MHTTVHITHSFKLLDCIAYRYVPTGYEITNKLKTLHDVFSSVHIVKEGDQIYRDGISDAVAAENLGSGTNYPDSELLWFPSFPNYGNVLPQNKPLPSKLFPLKVVVVQRSCFVFGKSRLRISVKS
jgi:hypothetical protein